MTTNQLNSVQAWVSIYPYEGGSYTLNNGNSYLLSVETSKSLYGPYGTFSIALSSGGPTGTTSPSWTQIITPHSFVTIGFVRGGTAQLVMAGIVTSVTESQNWSQKGAQRVTTISGADIGFFFAASAYYNLAFLLGAATASLGAVGMSSVQALGLVQGTPAEMAKTWYTDIMAGTSATAGNEGGVLATTKFNIHGQSYPFASIIASWFEEFNGPINIPTGTNFLADQGDWAGKFQALLQAPFYEFFINTAPAGTYPSASTATAIYDPSHRYSPSNVFLVGRVNPLPYLVNTGTVTVPQWSLNLDRWTPLFDARTVLTPTGFIRSDVEFSEDGVRNFYILNPVNITQMFGSSNDSATPFIATQALWKDVASLQRYGYRPEIFETQWWYDPDGLYAKQLAAQGKGAVDVNNAYNDLLCRIMSFYQPLALMARGSLVIPMRPDIMIGTVVSYEPFKDGVEWTFYVDSVSHGYSFGDGTSTTLTLSRGLPTAVYKNTSLLIAIHTGNASRISGAYQLNPSGATPGLTSLTLTSSVPQDSLATPQSGRQPST